MTGRSQGFAGLDLSFTVEKYAAISSAIAADNGLRYLLFAGVAWLLGYVIFRQRWARRKIIPDFPARTEMRREILLSLLSALIYGLVGAATLWATHHGWTQVYFRFAEYGRAWFWASVVLTIFVHDAYFYWTHRWMHHPRLFRPFHRSHHLSMNPSPWAAYAFDPLEAIVQAGIFPLVAILYPIHPLAFFLFMFWQLTFNIFGHTGYELWPTWFMNSPLGKFMNSPTAHILHHQHLRGHYGLYFNIWDRLMGTNLDHYEATFREVTSPHRHATNSSH